MDSTQKIIVSLNKDSIHINTNANKPDRIQPKHNIIPTTESKYEAYPEKHKQEPARYNTDYSMQPHLSYYCRKSWLTRILLGTSISTFTGGLFSYTLINMKIQPQYYFLNFTKGSFLIGLSFFSINELTILSCNYFSMYNNFVLSNSLSAYSIHYFFFRHLVRNRGVNYFEAHYYSSKVLMILLCGSMTVELVMYLLRKVYLYDDRDVMDNSGGLFDSKGNIDWEKIKKEKGDKTGVPGVLVFNSKKKNEEVEEYMRLAKKIDSKGGNTFNPLKFILYKEQIKSIDKRI